MNKSEYRWVYVSIITVLLLCSFLSTLTVDLVQVYAQSSETQPLVAIHVSEYTASKWFYDTWRYFQIYSLLEEALRSDGTPFIEITDAQIETGALVTTSGQPKYPILFSLAAECISSVEAQKIKEYVQAGGFAYAGSSSWTRKPDGSPYTVSPPTEQVTVIADSTWDNPPTPGGDPRYAPEKTLDFDTGTYWFTDNGVYDSNGLPVNGPINITYTFENVHEINIVELTQTAWQSTGGLEYKTKDYEVWLSTDGTTWNNVGQNTLPSTPSAVQQTSFSAQNAKKIRITITSVWEPQLSHAAGLAEFRAYTTSGGMLPEGTSVQSEFWLSNEMGLKCLPAYHDAARPELGGQDWWDSWCNVGISGRGVLVDNSVDNRLVNHIPKGLRLLWILPSAYNQRPSGGTTHLAWATSSNGATVLATLESTGSVPGNSGGYANIPLIAYKNYGNGTFIYHSELASLAGYGGFSVDSFTYAFFRKATEWAFEANKVPLVRLAPWQYPKKAAFIIRLDGDGGPSDIMSYVAIDEARGVRGEYYIVTNTVSDPSLLTTASGHGAIIGSHSDYHTGPDSEGYSAAVNNINTSLNQLEGWLGTRPKIWVSPMYDAIADQSFQAIEDCGLVSAGEQGVGPIPHFALSMETEGKHYNVIELPTQEYLSSDAPYSPIMECDVPFYTDNSNPDGTMAKAIDFAYSQEGLINIYAHFRGSSTDRRAFYIDYSKTKPDVWFTSSQDIYNWMVRRDQVRITSTYEHGSTGNINVSVSGPADSGPFALNIRIPWSYGDADVKVNGVPVSNYEILADGWLKVSCPCPSQVEVVSNEAPPHAETVPVVAVHVSGYTETHWPYTTWKYFQLYSILEEALRSDGTPFVEITDSQIENGALMTASGSIKYPILFSLGAECISTTEAQEIKEYVEAGGFAYASSSSWTRKQNGTPNIYVTPSTVTVVADSTWGPAYAATNTLDGNPSSQWFMQNDLYDSITGLPKNGPVNITYTFDHTREINMIEIVQTQWTGTNYKTKDYEIWTSPSGITWTKVAQNTLPATDNISQQTSFSPSNATIVKIVITSVWAGQGANTGGLAEFKAFTTDGETLPAPVPPPEYTFILAQEMGLESLPTYYEIAKPELGNQERWNSWANIGIAGRGVLVENITNHRLVEDMPKGVRLLWISPSNYDTNPASDTSTHYAWATNSTGATVLATLEWTGSVDKTSAGYNNITLLAYNKHGNGYFIYHSELATPLAYGSWGPDTFTYGFVRKAVEWAFETNNVPLVRLAPWQFPNQAAFIVRTDCDGGIAPIMDYVTIDEAHNISGEYYVVTNDAASSVPDPAALLNEAEAHGATIGTHASYHTGPDSQDYATGVSNINGSLDTLQTWLGYRPKIWVSPMYDAIKEQSLQVIQDCGLITAGEQGFGPYPHFALSMQTKGKHYNVLELPILEYFSTDGDYEPILHCDGPFYTDCNDPNGTMSKAIDVAYNLEGLINIYSHFRPGNLERRAFYEEYTKTKPDVWFTNSQDIYDWWLRRNQVNIAAAYISGFGSRIDVTVSGPEDPGPFALNIKIPWQYQTIQVKINGVIVSDYEITAEGLKVSCSSPSQVEILLETPTLTMSPASKTCREYNESFAITITLTNDYGFTDFEFEIDYNSTLLDCAGVTWNAWGSGTVNVDEVNGNITGFTSGLALSGTQTLITLQFNAAYHHIWKYESRVPGWRNDQSGLILFKWVNLSYEGLPDRVYIRGGGQNQINVGPDVTYTFSSIQGDLDNNGKVDIYDLRTIAALFKQSNAAYDLNGDGIIDIFDVVTVAANYGFAYP